MLGDGPKAGLLYYVLADIVSDSPQILFGDSKGTSTANGEYFEIVSGRGSHAKGKNLNEI